MIKRLGNLLKSAALGLVGLVATSNVELRAAENLPYETRFAMAVLDESGQETRILRQGQDYRLQVLMDKPFSTDPVVNANAEVKLPKEVEVVYAVDPSEYGANDVFYGKKMGYNRVNGNILREVELEFDVNWNPLPRDGFRQGKGVLAEYIVRSTGTNLASATIYLDGLLGEGPVVLNNDGTRQRSSQKTHKVLLAPGNFEGSAMLNDSSNGDTEHPIDGRLYSPVVASDAGVTNVLLSSSKCLNGEWTPLRTNVGPFVVYSPAEGGQRFYRTASSGAQTALIKGKN